jgi:hypothetical protein
MLKFFTPQLVTRNSQPSPPGSKKLAVDLGLLRSAIGMMECWNIGMLDLEDWGNRVWGVLFIFVFFVYFVEKTLKLMPEFSSFEKDFF